MLKIRKCLKMEQLISHTRFIVCSQDMMGKLVPECYHPGLLQQEMTQATVTTGTVRYAKLQLNHHHQYINTRILYRPDALPVTQKAA